MPYAETVKGTDRVGKPTHTCGMLLYCSWEIISRIASVDVVLLSRSLHNFGLLYMHIALAGIRVTYCTYLQLLARWLSVQQWSCGHWTTS